MARVDSKGRIVIPRDVRERLGVTPGTEVDVREEDGKAIVEPEDDPEQVLERLEELVDGISERDPEPYDDLDPHARNQVDAIRRQANRDEEIRNGSGDDGE